MSDVSFNFHTGSFRDAIEMIYINTTSKKIFLKFFFSVFLTATKLTTLQERLYGRSLERCITASISSYRTRFNSREGDTESTYARKETSLWPEGIGSVSS